jgi:hypothetical protein
MVRLGVCASREREAGATRARGGREVAISSDLLRRGGSFVRFLRRGGNHVRLLRRGGSFGTEFADFGPKTATSARTVHVVATSRAGAAEFRRRRAKRRGVGRRRAASAPAPDPRGGTHVRLAARGGTHVHKTGQNLHKSATSAEKPHEIATSSGLPLEPASGPPGTHMRTALRTPLADTPDTPEPTPGHPGEPRHQQARPDASRRTGLPLFRLVG